MGENFPKYWWVLMDIIVDEVAKIAKPNPAQFYYHYIKLNI
jgi:hypothetical protein